MRKAIGVIGAVLFAILMAAPTFAQYPEIQVNLEKEWTGKTYEYTGGPGQDIGDYLTWPIIDTRYTVDQAPGVETEGYPGCPFDPNEYPEYCEEHYIDWVDNFAHPYIPGGVCSHSSCEEHLDAECQKISDQRHLGGGPSPYAACGGAFFWGNSRDLFMVCSCTCQGTNMPEVVVAEACSFGVYF
jgi:hypothetical protein